ncbi:MAG: CBS domain-containing protein [Planctomycetota bacterium]|jgi:CBS domain-containing protein
MLKAKDVMTKDVIAVKRETPVREAVQLLIRNEITGVPVVEDDMTLVGVFTEKDALRLLYAHSDERYKPVGDFMTRPAVYYDENDSVQAVCDFMVVNYFRRVPVISKEGKVVGIISRPDVIRYIFRTSRESAGVDTR